MQKRLKPKAKLTVGRLRVHDGVTYRVNEVTTSYGVDEIIQALQRQGDAITESAVFKVEDVTAAGQLTHVRASWEVVVGAVDSQEVHPHGNSGETEYP